MITIEDGIVYEIMAADINALNALMSNEEVKEKEDEFVKRIIKKLSAEQVDLMGGIADEVKKQNLEGEGDSGCIKVSCSVDRLLQVAGNYTSLLNTLETLCDKGWSMAGKAKKKVYKCIYSYEIVGIKIELLADEKLLTYF